jgi:hypothetical protein
MMEKVYLILRAMNFTIPGQNIFMIPLEWSILFYAAQSFWRSPCSSPDAVASFTGTLLTMNQTPDPVVAGAMGFGESSTWEPFVPLARPL